MVRHEAACRRWRACVAMHNMSTSRGSCSCGSSHKLDEYPEGHWQDLSKYISALESSDVVLKMEAVHHLALFLLYVAPTSESTFTCPDAHTISLHFQNKSIFLALKDIQSLYGLIFSELANRVAWLFKEFAGKNSGQTLPNHFCGSDCDRHGSYCDHANMEFTVKILQCCIYILPLLEFNTGLSLVAAETLNSLFKQLVCPANLFRLNCKEFDEVVDNYRTLLLKQLHNCDRWQAFCCVQCARVHSNLPVLLITSVEASIKGVLEDLPSVQNADHPFSCMFQKKTTSCPVHAKHAHNGRGQFALALLEVFLEELLLQPRFADILKSSDFLDSSQTQCCPKKYVALIVEAAAMHFIFSLLGVAHNDMLQESVEHASLTQHESRLSLPAAVMLLDLSMIEDMHAPDTFLVHIINILRCSLENSRCSITELPGEMVLGLVASALESATCLYVKCWKANAVPPHHNFLRHGELHKCLSDMVQLICNGDTKKVACMLDLLLDQEIYSKTSQQENGSTHPGLFCTSGTDVMSFKNEMFQCSLCGIHSYASVYNGQRQELPMNNNGLSPSETLLFGTNTTLLVSLLHLISRALLRLALEAAKTFQILTSPNSTEQNTTNAEVYVRHVKQVFTFCASVDRNKVFTNLNLDKDLQDGILEVDELTGNAFTFFAEQLSLCIKHGAPKALVHAYLEVMKSLLILNCKLQRRDTLISACASKLSCKAQLGPSCDVILTNTEKDQNDQHTNVIETNTDEDVIPTNTEKDQSTDDQHTIVIETNTDEDQNIDAELTDTQPCQNGCKQHTHAQPCSDGCEKHTAEFVSSTLSMTKIYQRKHKNIVSTYRRESSIAACGNEQLDCKQCRKLQEGEKLRKKEMFTPSYTSSGNGDAYIKEVIACVGNVDGESFSDLSDFIVCKEGRNYSRWMKLRHKKRKKKIRKTLWQRMKAKRALVSLLSRQRNEHL